MRLNLFEKRIYLATVESLTLAIGRKYYGRPHHLARIVNDAACKQVEEFRLARSITRSVTRRAIKRRRSARS